MMRVWLLVCLWFAAIPAAAQTYIQVEAQPSLSEGVATAEQYQRITGNAQGFRLGDAWYAVVLGPFDVREAEIQLQMLRRAGRIPRDSYLTTLENYGQQYYPGDSSAPQPAQTALPALPDETPAEARRAELSLTAQDRVLVQMALTGAEVYSGAIDGAFGQGTRQAMAAWQAANGYQTTGILTTAQRTALIQAHNAVFEGLGMERVAEQAAGIEITLPAGVVTRDGETSPFVRYGPAGDLPVEVLLISQRGDRAALAALYEIIQTLEIVPLEGPRTRRPTSFDIEGRNDEIVSTTWVELLGDEIKGFALVWPAGDEQRRTRVLDEMRRSFARLPGTLPTALQPDTPAADLLMGLDVRKADRDRSGFYVDGAGTVLTTHEAVQSCERVTLDDEVEAEVAAEDEGLGLALLRPRASLSPIRYARFRTTPPQRRSEVAVAGYPFGGILSAPSLNFGRLEEARGLDGNASLSRLVLASEPGETGGPVFDGEGAVLGILQPSGDGARRLPDDVAFATAAGPIADFLTAAGLSPEPSNGGPEVPPEDLTRLAADMTVLVGCWN